MEITLGDKIKINGEEVPEYLLKALYEKLHTMYAKTVLNDTPMIITLSDDKTQVISLTQENKTVYYFDNKVLSADKGVLGFPRELAIKNATPIRIGAVTYPWSK